MTAMNNQIYLPPFIAVDGGDAVGKTTICQYIAQVLKEEGETPVLTVGHAHGEFGGLVRSTILHPWTADSSHTSQLLLFLANRRYIMEEVVNPAREKGAIPVVDRWHLTSHAYQPNAHNKRELMFNAVPVLPTLNIVLLADREKSLERRANRNRSTDHLEERAISDAVNLNGRFREGAEEGCYAHRTVIIDANRPLELVCEDVKFEVLNELREHRLRLTHHQQKSE